MEDIWTEKYRPRTIDDIVGQQAIKERLTAYVKSHNIPHLLFAGPAGVGKTTSAMALARDFYGEDWRVNFLELNASDERKLEVVRTKIKDFARTAALGEDKTKMIFLDEADNLTRDAQAALRRTMEKFTRSCRFILSCNYSSKIIEPIQSRCAVFRFRRLTKDDVRLNIERIAKAEGLKVEPDALDGLVEISDGDLRRATNLIQVAGATDALITADTVYFVSSMAKPKAVEEMLVLALKADFTRAKEKLYKLLIDQGLAASDLVLQIHDVIFSLDVEDRTKMKMIRQLADTEFRLIGGSNEHVQMQAFLAHCGLIGYHNE